AENDVGTAGTRLQAGVQRLVVACIGPRRKERRIAAYRCACEHILAAVISGRQFDAELYPKIMRRQNPLVTANQLDIAKSCTARTADIGRIDLGCAGIAISSMATVYIRNN